MPSSVGLHLELTSSRPKDHTDFKVSDPTSVVNASRNNRDATRCVPWPVSIHGIPVGELGGLCELAINIYHGRISIWAFASSGKASVWQVDCGLARMSTTQHTVAMDSRVMVPSQTHVDGDVGMEEAAASLCHRDDLAETHTMERHHLGPATS